MKSKKLIIYLFPNINFRKFLREAEWKYLNRNETNSEKNKEFFEDYDYINNLVDIIILNENEFLSDSDIIDEIDKYINGLIYSINLILK